jgi:integrase
VPLVETLIDTDIRRWVNQREAAGAAPKTIGNYHGLMFGIMAHAVRKGLRADNPCADTKLPRADDDADTDDEMVFLTEAEFRHVLEAIHQDSKDLLLVAVGTGLRWGELSALQVRD